MVVAAALLESLVHLRIVSTSVNGYCWGWQRSGMWVIKTDTIGCESPPEILVYPLACNQCNCRVIDGNVSEHRYAISSCPASGGPIRPRIGFDHDFWIRCMATLTKAIRRARCQTSIHPSGCCTDSELAFESLQAAKQQNWIELQTGDAYHPQDRSRRIWIRLGLVFGSRFHRRQSKISDFYGRVVGQKNIVGL